MTVVALAGDSHGNYPWARDRIREVAERGVDTMLHLGDFGIWPGNNGRAYLIRVENACAEHGMRILVTPGNHEDWGRLTALWENPKQRDATGAMLPIDLTPHITVLPRGHRFEIDGRSFVSLGGAPSVDMDNRTERVDWWPEERITAEDVERTVAGGYADVMLSHDSPDRPYQTAAVEHVVHGDSGWSWSDQALAHAAAGRERMTEAFLGVKPRLFAHGHYHVRDEASVQIPGADHETRIWSLHADGRAGNLRFLDLETLDDPEWTS